VRSGLLVSALEATGVGTADVVDAVAVPEAIGMTPRARPMPERKRAGLSVVPEPERAPEDEEKQRAADERRALQAAVDQAVAAADEARKRVRKSGKRVEKVQARTLQAAEELEEARRLVAELEHELETLDGEVEKAEVKLQTAEQRYAEAQEVLEEARSRL
jgi:chromosome segregation ATPase